jgi:ATP-binding cassette subfamily B (MDR/TAP) protein 1
VQALKSIFSILDRETGIDPTNPIAQEVLEMRGDISLKHIHFTYPSRPDTVIFKDFSLKVHAGRSLALVGASGSGNPCLCLCPQVVFYCFSIYSLNALNQVILQ